jgi:threonine dehydratase
MTLLDRSYIAQHMLDVTGAAHTISGHVRRTPTVRCDLDPNLRLKLECFQVTGSFKARGAFNAVQSLVLRRTPRDEHKHMPKLHGVIAVSSGNHGQALALAARTAGVPALILIPADANPAKVAATRALGAEVIQEGITFANRELRLKEVMAERDYDLVHPFNDWDVIHGQGTAALEMLEDSPDIDVVAAPLGGGGLLSGSAIVARAQNRNIKVVGVEPERANDAFQTWKAGSIQTLPAAPDTLADGVRTMAVGERTFEVMFGRGLVDEVVTVSEDEIAEAVRLAWTRLHLAVEPTGALPLAAFLSGKLPKGRTGLILSGANANLETVAKLLSH